jgi:Polymerase beta, Nucleotidyltransferase
MKYGLSDGTVQKKQAVLKGYQQVDQAILYGSRAKGNYKNGSDIDLTLYRVGRRSQRRLASPVLFHGSSSSFQEARKGRQIAWVPALLAQHPILCAPEEIGIQRTLLP